MKGIKVLLGLSITAVGISAVSLGVASTNKTSLNTVSASAPTNQRRIWIINNHDWWVDNNFFVYAWNDSGDCNTAKVTNVLAQYDYYHGFGYVDVSLTNATSAFKLRVVNSWGDYGQTVVLNIPALGGEDVVWMNSGNTWDATENRHDRDASLGTTNGFNGGQLAFILSKFDTCSDAVTNGYNAYPQLKPNFFDKTSSSVFSTEIPGDEDYTIQDYIDGMYARYSA